MFLSIFFKGYKSFRHDKIAKLSDLARVNVIIGKNNSGKTSVLDIVNAVYDTEYFSNNKDKFHENLEATFLLQADHFAPFGAYSRIGNIYNPIEYVSKRFAGKPLRVVINSKKESFHNFYEWLYSYSTAQDNAEFNIDEKGNRTNFEECWNRVAGDFAAQNKDFLFRRLSAETNIVPEAENQTENLEIDGSGASNLIRKFITFSDYDETLIESILLHSLNKIMYPEATFDSIKVQQIEKNDTILWEVFLQEKGCARFALSQSGSGLKTIILLLLNLLVIPKTKKYEGKRIVFGFEELENNLHPSLQRRLFEYIYDYALTNDVYVFLTTHSHIAINTFYGKDEAQIFHVSKLNNVSSLKKIDNYLDKVNILDDLEVHASDLLQSNGIIWVEGPSDRIYIKRWLEVLCNCKYEEGRHYQFLYYGGRLLSHYSAEETSELIGVLTTNRNAAIVIDSDKKSQQVSINSTKKRIVEEFEKYRMLAWISKGKEIENYLSPNAIALAVEKTVLKQCNQYQLFPDYIKPYYSNFQSNKVAFANAVKKFITIENSLAILDLEKQIKKLYEQIQRWNN